MIKLGTVLASLSFIVLMFATGFRASTDVIYATAGALIVGMFITAVGVLRARLRQGAVVPRHGAMAVPQAQFAVTVMIPAFGFIGGVVAAILQIQDLPPHPTVTDWVSIAFTVVLILIAVFVFFALRAMLKKGKDTGNGTEHNSSPSTDDLPPVFRTG